MRIIVIALTFLAAGVAAARSVTVTALANEPANESAGEFAGAPGIVPPSSPSRPATEQYWVIADVIAAIKGMSGTSSLPGAPFAEHVWSPGMYRAVAEAAFDPAPADVDLNVRIQLLELTTDTLLAQSARVSAVLQRNMRAPAAHEAAALTVGAFALRESAGWFDDVRPALSRMTAHLAVARALRRPSTDETLDGALAHAILSALAGRQREAMALVDGVEARAASDGDRAWVRALRLRVTGDWRAQKPTAVSPLLVQLEYARAVRTRLGIDAYTDYLETLPDSTLVGWSRLAFSDWLSVEAGHIFTDGQIENEILESAAIWSEMHGRQATFEDLLKALNDRPTASPVERTGASVTVHVLDWGTWAAHQQRHLAHAMMARAHHYTNLGDDERREALPRELENQMGDLTLFPLALRWMATTPAQHQRALDRARALVQSMPEVVNQSAWTMLLEKPAFVDRPVAFPLDVTWFSPAVPAGTAFDLGARSMRQGASRRPTVVQVAAWARDRPYDNWTVWKNEWYIADGPPPLSTVRKAFGQLLDYDAVAITRVLDHIPMAAAQRIETATSLCALVTVACDRVADLLLLDNRVAEAAEAYDRWADGSRDRVGVSNGVAWLFRYHLAQGHVARAEAIARMAEDTGSSRGLELLAEWHERHQRHDEAERLLQAIIDRYTDSTAGLGTFLMRRSLASSDRALQTRAAALLRQSYPIGLEPLAMQALPATPADGVRFGNFGARPAALGFEPSDVIVGVDGWRVRNALQYLTAVRFDFDEQVTFTVFRKGSYEQVRTRVPERRLGTQLLDVGP
jgi:hypothetical protein